MHTDVTTVPDRDEPGAAALVAVCADGLVLLDADGRFRSLNPAALRLLGRPADELVGVLAPFVPGPVGPSGTRTVRWTGADGSARELRYRAAPDGTGGLAVWFSDVTDRLARQERLTAIVRAAAGVAEAGSLAGTLDAIAREIIGTAHIAAAQILAVDDPAADLQVLGMAGFGAAPDFVRRLRACREGGADIRFLEAHARGEAVVVPHRRAAIMADPAWEPLHEIMDRPDWDGFVAMPMVVRGTTVGVINAYYEPDEAPDPSSLAFLEAMAAHAAVAVDTARLVARSRSDARTAERRRLARDLHDSVVQQLFSIRMQVSALQGRLDRSDPDPARVLGAATELSAMSADALDDLRLLVREMHPAAPRGGDLVEAVRTHASEVQSRTGLRVDVVAPVDPRLGPGVTDDLYRTVREALHNAVKHAGADTVRVRIERSDGDLVVEVADDGSGTRPADPPASVPGGLGLVSMRERAERWGGACSAGPRPDGGWTVRTVLPVSGLDEQET
ncbi:histidine kinase [Pseudonocardia sp. TMWB2A]|uniref:PAS domain-containing sensor histidine kinase n=1 Tax=Pseudonocardia sp. TMWB2A TaxID=687430 RepID=UPI00307D7185